MLVVQKKLIVETRGKGTYEISHELDQFLKQSELTVGTLNVFCCHTSCSLVLMENADPTARRDLEAYFEKLVPEDLPYFQHTYEGPDDMPSHIKMALTRSSETIPFNEQALMLGTWQGIFLWEHRSRPHRRQLVLTLMGA